MSVSLSTLQAAEVGRELRKLLSDFDLVLAGSKPSRMTTVCEHRPVSEDQGPAEARRRNQKDVAHRDG
jgi:hypothetical protein